MAQMPFEKADELREFLFTIIESLPNGILLADRDGFLLAVNRKASALLGMVGSSMQNRSCWEIMAQALGVSREDMAKLKKPGGRILTEISNSPHSEGKKFVSIARNDLKSPFLHISGFFLSFEDVTYLVMLEGQIDRRKRFTAMKDMAAHMSQELKNPLGSLELYASMLKRELRHDPDNERITIQMTRAVRTMDHLLNNYVAFASLPAPHFGRLAVREWLDETVAQLCLLDKGGHVFIVDYKHEDDLLAGDADLLLLLSINIGMNAMESMKESGEIRIETRTLPISEGHPGFVEIKFMDQGRGIPKKDLDTIFDPFFTTKDRASGLGLAIVHHIIDAHHGLVKIESNEGVGTSVIVLLPTGIC